MTRKIPPPDVEQPRRGAASVGEVTIPALPIQYARYLTSPERSTAANRHLGFSLALVAGGASAGAFLAVRQYTSHMTGIVSLLADSLALGDTVHWRCTTRPDPLARCARSRV